MSIEVLRSIMVAVHQSDAKKVVVRVNDKVADYLNNKKRREISELEGGGEVNIQIFGAEGLFPEHLELEARDESGQPLTVQSVKQMSISRR